MFVEKTRSAVLATLNLRCLFDMRRQMTLNIDLGTRQEALRVSHVVTEFKTIKLLEVLMKALYPFWGNISDILRV